MGDQLQHLHPALPVVTGAKPGKIDGEGGVVPAVGQLGAVVDQAQRTQGRYQQQLVNVEVPELLVAIDQCSKLARALDAVAMQAQQGNARVA